MSVSDPSYMHRCIELARLGAGSVAPNPMVGAVLVHSGRIIGEGYHAQYGKAHAEVNCINSVQPEDVALIASSTLYVSLEPCAHFGKTPPCSDLVIRHRIPKVVIGCRDPFPLVNGKGLEKLQQAGIETELGMLEAECRSLNQRFFTFATQQRPYVVLKWAQTADGKIAGSSSERLLISHPCTNRLVHRWRSEEAAILVGTNTAVLDDPSLTNRLWHGKNPVRLLLDLSLRVLANHQLLDGSERTIVFNHLKEDSDGKTQFHQLDAHAPVLTQVLDAAYRYGLQSILVEGGARLLQSFIDAGCWNEARVITNTTLTANGGLPAPLLQHASATGEEQIGSDRIAYFTRTL